MDILRLVQEVPPFRREGQRYDMNTFVGRMLHFYSVNDPRTLLFTLEEAKAAERLLKQHELGEAPTGTTDADLWHARRVLESALHPDTGERIFPLFRFSAFVPVNMVIVTATITPAVISSFPATAFIHFMNQTYNAAINYANRNASNPIPQARLAEGYGGAVATSLSIGMLATALTKKVARAGGAGSPAAAVIRSTLPFLAVSFAGASNVVLMRRNELTTGVDVFDDEGKDLGKSVEVCLRCVRIYLVWNFTALLVEHHFRACWLCTSSKGRIQMVPSQFFQRRFCSLFRPLNTTARAAVSLGVCAQKRVAQILSCTVPAPFAARSACFLVTEEGDPCVHNRAVTFCNMLTTAIYLAAVLHRSTKYQVQYSSC